MSQDEETGTFFLITLLAVALVLVAAWGAFLPVVEH